MYFLCKNISTPCSLLILGALPCSVAVSLQKLITYKKPPKTSHPEWRNTASSFKNNKMYIPVNAFNHNILTASTQTTADEQKIFLNMKIMEYQHNKLDNTVFIRGLYGCVKILKIPTVQVLNDDSDTNE
ncbi:Gm28269 [Phodopus roborovskii]|uniref:Gm28269 protein n=1 Tax=Phodopus roborovskii TaxID=109678 RepID=A0AAU9YY11_PHORO|nr:Gm28269 [Phodopus roborovskii]